MKKRAWLLGLVIMAALLTLAAAALASGGGNIAGQNQVGGEPSSTGRTDDPAGRVQVPVPAVDAPKNNIRAMEAEEATPLDRTDDPLGRVQIPAVYDPQPDQIWIGHRQTYTNLYVPVSSYILNAGNG